MSDIQQDVKNIAEDMINNTWLWMPNWKWGVLAAGIVSSVALYKILTWIFGALRLRMKARMEKYSVSAIILGSEIQKPIALLFSALFLGAVVRILSLPGDGAHIASVLIKFVIAYSLIRLAYMGADSVGARFTHLASKTTNTLDDQLAPLLTRTLKFLVVVFGILVTLQNVGVNVVSVLAGLGLGGLAVALAAQDTFANIFGSITLIFDRPFQIGDSIKIGDIEGTVEEIGLRSTRMRLATNSLVSVPNSVMAKEKIENLGARSSRRIRHTLGLSYDTTPQKMLEFIDHVRYMLQQHPDVDKDKITVSFVSFGDSSLNVLVNCYLNVSELMLEQKTQQEILLQIMQIAEHQKVSFAFPTRSIRIEADVTKENSTNLPQPTSGGEATR